MAETDSGWERAAIEITTEVPGIPGLTIGNIKGVVPHAEVQNVLGGEARIRAIDGSGHKYIPFGSFKVLRKDRLCDICQRLIPAYYEGCMSDICRLPGDL